RLPRSLAADYPEKARRHGGRALLLTGDMMMKTLKQKLICAALAGGLSALLALPALAGDGLFVTRPPVDPLAITARPEVQAITAKADALGRAFTGAPVSWLEEVPGGHRVRYQRCEIYYSPATGAFEVHGDIAAKYNALGAATLGLPTSDELV